jgi:TATA-binding protein-associated factor Taf7
VTKMVPSSERDECKGAVRIPVPDQDRSPTAGTEERLSPPPQEKTSVLGPRVDKEKQPKWRSNPLRAPSPSVPAESSTRREDPTIQIPEEGQTMAGFLRILKDELLKELKGDIRDHTSEFLAFETLPGGWFMVAINLHG